MTLSFSAIFLGICSCAFCVCCFYFLYLTVSSRRARTVFLVINGPVSKTGCGLYWKLNKYLLIPAESVGEGNGTHSSILAWKIPWTEEPGGLQSMGSLRVGHDWATLLSLFTFMHWRRKWQPTPVFLPGESQGWGSLVGCRLWGRTESDTTEAT